MKDLGALASRAIKLNTINTESLICHLSVVQKWDHYIENFVRILQCQMKVYRLHTHAGIPVLSLEIKNKLLIL